MLVLYMASPLYTESSDEPQAPQSIPSLIAYFSGQYSVSRDQMTATISCESNFDPAAIGDNGESIGIVQIHLPDHKEVTAKQAEDPIFSIQFMAQEFSKGHQHYWSCYRMLYKKNTN